MANPEHVALLKQGEKVWNAWRVQNFNMTPDLEGANLNEADLTRAILARADLRGASLIDTNLTGANLGRANLNGANLNGARLGWASLIDAYLDGADLTDTDLPGADLSRAWLERTNFTSARMSLTVLGAVDLSTARGLDQVRHTGRSTIGIDTLYRSKGKIPEIFLRGAGVPDEIIALQATLRGDGVSEVIIALQTIPRGKPIEFYSCFISYSSKDEAFAERLYADLQAKGVRCWFAPEDLKIGDKFPQLIEESIRVHDKLLLVISANSISSNWVEREVEAAREREDREKRMVLFPIRLDDAVMSSDTAWASTIRRSRHIGDFRSWKDHDEYQHAFERLLRDLAQKRPISPST